MSAFKAWVLITAVITALVIVMMVYTPPQLIEFNNTLNHFTGYGIVDAELEKNLYPCKIKQLGGGSKEINYVFEIPPVEKRQAALITVPKGAKVEVNKKLIESKVNSTSVQTVFYYFLEPSANKINTEIRVINCKDNKPILQLAYDP